jgi:hypothetical protein
VGTGLIYAAIVVAWAAYLVPLALRRYDEAARTRSIDTFSNAMRVLGRREPARSRGLGAELVTPARPLASPRVLTPTRKAEAAETVARPTKAARRRAAQRRRRVLLSLLTVAAVVGGVTAFGLLPWYAVAVAVAVVVGWLVVCRVQVRRLESTVWEQSLTQPARKPRDRKQARRAARVDSSYGGGFGDEPDDDPTVVITAAELEARPGRHEVDDDADPVSDGDLAEEMVAAVPVATSDGHSLWDPLPVTLPTYVSKPKAPRTVRSIEFGEPGAWTSGHVEGEQTELPETTDETSEDEQRRAVGD